MPQSAAAEPPNLLKSSGERRTRSRRDVTTRAPAVQYQQGREELQQEEREDSDSEDEKSASSTSTRSSTKVPKPVGEAGRPGRGGYSLKETLAWPLEDYRKLQVM